MFDELEKILGFSFKNKDLLKTAFIHRSYLNEHSEENLPHNERLEFLGDSVLGFIVSEHLYLKYPNHPEGDLTNFRSSLVNARTLAEISQKLSLGKFLLLSKGEEATGGRERQYILANTFESLLGAIYLDSGVKNAHQLISQHLLPELDQIISKKLYKDFKSGFQELAQEKRNITPTYRVLNEEGPDHNRTFTVGVFLNEEKIAQGSGKSKQLAEQVAASEAIAKLEEIR